MKLKNAQQSTTETDYSCTGNKCPAGAAIDGDLATHAVTVYGSDQWWKCEIDKTIRIDYITLRLNGLAITDGQYNR